MWSRPTVKPSIWVEPAVDLAKNYGLNASDLGKVEALIKEHEEEIRDAWRRHFGS